MKRAEILQLDGAAGEGGGQILRTALALSLITGRPFRIENIRARRRKPGLLRQHLTAVRAAQEVGDAVTDGAEIGSLELVFRPGKLRAGDYRFAIGTAGSTTLVLQTVLPALLLAEGESSVSIEGGTHNPAAPPFDFILQTFLPQLARSGANVEATLVRPGFFPAGGGRIDVRIAPHPRAHWQGPELLERGEDGGRQVVAHLASLPESIAERAFAQVARRLGWASESFGIVKHSGSCGIGFALVAQVASQYVAETFIGFGEKGVSSERVADSLINQVRAYLAHTAPVGEFLADQLLLPMALAQAGAFRTKGITPHAQTNMGVIEQFLPIRFHVSPQSDGSKVVSVAPA